MKKRIVITAILFVLFIQTSVFAGVSTAPYVTDEMQDPQYWISHTRSPHKILMSAGRIEVLNQSILDTPATNTRDLTKEPETFDGIVLRDQLGRFEITANYYSGELLLAPEYFEKVRNNILNAKAEQYQAVLYGLCTSRADLKAYPIAEILSDSSLDPEYDDFQNSRVLVNEPVLIYVATEDQKWYWVKTKNCTGWVEAGKIAVCPTREQWLEAQNPEKFLVVTGEKIRLEAGRVNPALSELSLSMGTILPLVKEEEIPESIDNRYTWNNYVVKIPVRNLDGSFELKPALIPKNRDVSVGYLPLTYENLLKQMFKMLGNRYGWGSMLEAQDCSSYVMDVYSCFGFRLPRNTTWQREMPVSKIDLSNFSRDAKEDVLDNLMPGDLLQFPGHVMMYLGKVNGRYYVISAVGSLVIPYEDNSSPVTRIRSVVINDLSVKRASGLTWLESMSHVLIVTRQMEN